MTAVPSSPPVPPVPSGPSAPSVLRVFGDRPFAEIGRPSVTVADGRSRLIAVGGDVGSLQWSGSGTADQRWTGHRIGVYDQRGLRCRHLLRSRYPVNSLAFHPVLPLLAVGTGQYDGGYNFEGELLLVRTDTGEAVSALPHPREVLHVEWPAATTLRMVMAPLDDWDDPRAHEQGHTVAIERADWAAVGSGGIDPPELHAPAAPFDRPDLGEDARRMLTGLAAAAGREWSPGPRAWAVEALADGRVLAARDGVLAEAWLPSGERQWGVEDELGGRQLVPSGDGTSVWVNAERRRPWWPESTEPSDPLVVRLDAADGAVLATVPVPTYVTLVAGGGRVVLRPRDNQDESPGHLLLAGPDGTFSEGAEITDYDLINHSFPVRRATRPYVLVGADQEEPHKDKWIAAVGADGTPRPLVPHSWEPGEHHFGGPAAENGQCLLYAGTVYDGRGLQPGGAFVVRRSLTDGAVRWQHRADVPATALDTDGELVHVAWNDGTLVALDAADGSVRWRTELRVHGVPTVALSLTVAPDGGLLAGTVDGRILRLGRPADTP
ncbi:PQQ-binding-like beta-propeller repeat protein [Streptomyces sp. NPDC048603]|uniref:outer membrane protein assembly factor BamB family protein n=1 Tax=Streptomyces sp. NPDC048603 TaxID=3365577 RepID=UPI0037212798